MSDITRGDGRTRDALRPVRLERGGAGYAEGTCTVSFGRTMVLCTASVEAEVERWRRGSGAGWVTAEYAMLPRATHTRSRRERSSVGGRTQEIQRLIGRSLRASMDLTLLGERTIRVDCDVLQADGGTRTAAITGGAIALHDACAWLVGEGLLPATPFQGFVAAVSAGLVGGQLLLDLDYAEDSGAEVDVNVVALESGGLIEIQGTGEKGSLERSQLDQLLDLSLAGISELVRLQQAAVE